MCMKSIFDFRNKMKAVELLAANVVLVRSPLKLQLVRCNCCEVNVTEMLKSFG